MDPIEYRPLPSAPPAQDLCLVCSNHAKTTPKKFPCGCIFHIHHECIPIWRTNNYTCPHCSQIVLNIVHPQQMNQMRIFSQYENSIRIARQNDCMCRVIIIVGIILFITVCIVVFLTFPWNAFRTK